MGRQGRRIPERIRRFVIETKRALPQLSQRRIAEKVKEQFGPDAGIDKSSVGRILAAEGLGSRRRGREAGAEEVGERGERTPLQALHLDELLALGRELAEALAVPGPRDGVDDPPVTKEEFFRRAPDAPGGAWYWDWDVGQPTLKVEASPHFRLLRQHTAASRFWADLEGFRRDLGGYLRDRRTLFQDIWQRAWRKTRLPILNEHGSKGGWLTPAFVRTVYDEGVTMAMRHLGSEQSLPAVPVSGYRQTPTRDWDIYLLWYDQQPIAGGSKEVIQTAFNAHRRLWAALAQDPKVVTVLRAYRDLQKRAEDLRTEFSPGILRKILRSTTCPACFQES